MAKLKELIATFSDNEIADFKQFITRSSKVKKRLDFKLIDILREKEEYSAEEISYKLYRSKKQLESYHALRKRLFRSVNDYITMTFVTDDHTESGPVMSMVHMIRYLFNHNCIDLAWRYIKKAQDKAEKSDQFRLLQELYLIQLDFFETKPDFDLEEVIDKMELNKQRMDEDDRIQMANALIRQRLNEHKKDMHFELENDVSEVLEKFKIEEVVETRPKFLYQLIEIIRSAKMANKAFYEIEPFVKKNYLLLQEKGFKKKDIEYQAGILYCLAHATFRNKKFQESLKWTNELDGLLSTMKKPLMGRFWAKTAMLEAANNLYSGNPENAIALLDRILTRRDVKVKEEAKLMALLNKSIYLFCMGRTKESAHILATFPVADRTIEKQMGREWLMKISLVRLVFQFDLGNYEMVISSVSNFHRNYAETLKKPIYSRVKEFVSVIGYFAKNSHLLGDSEHWERIDGKFERIDFWEEDLQAMTFYAWLRAKVNGMDFYDCLLKHIKFEGAQTSYL